MNLGFGSPLLLWGAALIAVPVIIHLLNRRRFVVQPFAAMEFLRAAFARRRRRMRTENLLLLLLRCLVVLLAALAMALPFVPSDSPLALVSGGRRELVLVVDRSASTGRSAGPGATVADRELEAVRQRIGSLVEDRGDAVTLITPGAAELLPAPIGAPPSRALQVLDGGLPPPAGVADLVDAVRVIKERVQPRRPGRLDIELFTDLQALSWGQDLGPLLADVLDLSGGTLRVVDVAADLPAVTNVGVVELKAQDPLLLAGESTTFSAVLRNQAETARQGLAGSFTLDGQLVQRVTGIDLPPRGTTSVETRLRVDAPGPHHLAFALEADELPFDDRRSLAFEARETVAVLLVDGHYEPARLERATGYLELALDPQVEASSGDDLRLSRFAPEVVEPRALDEDLSGWDVIVLADVGALSPSQADNLEETVRTGTPLLVFTGEDVRPDAYAPLTGRGLLPATVGERQGDPAGTGENDYVTLVLPDPAPPALELFADPRLAVLLQVPVLAWNDLLPGENAELLASFADALGHTTPAIVQGRLGLGRTVLVGTSADASWSLLPRQPATWVPLVHELLGALTAVDPSRTNVGVGQAPSLVLQAPPSRVRLERPSGAMQDIGRPEFETLGSRGQRCQLSLAATPLDEPGPFSLVVEFDGGVRPTRTLALAALPDAREGDLVRIDGPTLDQRLAGVDYVLGEAQPDAPEADLGAAGDGSLARFLLWCLLALAVAEAVFARFLGGRR